MTSIRHFDVSVNANNRPLVEVAHYPVYNNGITFLFGESGIGKSIISKSLYGYHSAPDLTITINGSSYARHCNSQWVTEVNRNSFFVFQEPSSHLNPLMKLREQLNEGSLHGIDDSSIIQQLWHSTDTRILNTILDIFPKAHRPSGGEKQRVLLAMAFKRISAWVQGTAPEATMFVFDEPTGSLDNNYRNLFLRLLFEQYSRRPFTATIITHDYSIISEIYRQYNQFKNAVHFTELTKTSDATVTVNQFSPEEYLSWLAIPKNHSFTGSAHTPVLSVSPQFSIFGRRLTIHSNRAHTTPAPLTINRGEMVYLKAPSGIGKTTLAKIIMGIYHPDHFSMTLDGVTIRPNTAPSVWPKKIWGKRAGMIFQHADESLNLTSTVRDTFKGLPLKQPLTPALLSTHLAELFDRQIIPTLLRKKVAHLSGGQKQRLNLLRTLVLETNLIILDEPLNGLDFNSVKKVLNLLDEKRAHGSALLMISHNEEIFENFIGEESIYHLACT